jgi:integrase/recombinase XerD
MTFTSYLQHKNLSPSTVRTYLKYHQTFNTWLTQSGEDPLTLSYPELLDFIQYAKTKGYSTSHINQLLCTVRHYYDHLKQESKTQENPATGIYLKGRTRRIAHDLLDATQLETVFTAFISNTISQNRNQVITGLIVYQALSKQELEALEPSHINLNTCHIKIPGSRKTNSRTLKLEANQMIGIQDYLNHIRTEILTTTGKQSKKLFISSGSGHKLGNVLIELIKQLRNTHDYVRSIRQLRQSRIAIWIKLYGLRRAQVMAGHRYVSSTERYQQSGIEELKESVNKFHPLG